MPKISLRCLGEARVLVDELEAVQDALLALLVELHDVAVDLLFVQVQRLLAAEQVFHLLLEVVPLVLRVLVHLPLQLEVLVFLLAELRCEALGLQAFELGDRLEGRDFVCVSPRLPSE